MRHAKKGLAAKFMIFIIGTGDEIRGEPAIRR
jgi:hypothetical protein